MFKSLLVGVAATVALALPARAAVAVDQSSLVGDGMTMTSYQVSMFAPGSSTPPWGYAQSFTAGVSGTLDSIQLGLINFGTAGTLGFRLYEGRPLTLSDPVLYSTTISSPSFFISLNVFTPWSSLPTIDLSAANLQLTAGQQYTFALTSQTQQSDIGLLDFANTNPFTVAGGDKYNYASGGFLGTIQPFGADFAFRTFVGDRDDSGVPEPSTWALMIAGVALAGAGLRRQRATGLRVLSR
jgi:hypothetical protein